MKENENIEIEPITEYITYTIIKRDTLSGIAKKYDCTVNELAKINSISNINVIIASHALKIPTKYVTFVEQKKEKFEEGDKAVPTHLFNYNVVPLRQYDDYYTISI